MWPTVHGQARTLDYQKWKSMKYRCHNKNHFAYYNYGARGITVCEEWRDNFQQFIDDMGPSEKGQCIDRIDNNKGYSKDNCKWSTPKENNRNKRNCNYYEHKGQMLILREICEDLNLNYVAIHKRISKKWDYHEAINTPIRGRRKKEAA